jgi:hypothetical protein
MTPAAAQLNAVRKGAPPVYNPYAAEQPAQRAASAPPVYRPNLAPATAQAKTMGAGAPPVYTPYTASSPQAERASRPVFQQSKLIVAHTPAKVASEQATPVQHWSSRPPRPNASTNAQAGGAVQPKVGFEFEIQNWKVFGPSASFNEKTKLMAGNGWHAVGDVWFPSTEARKVFAAEFGKENILSTGNLEFVTAAFEETDRGLEQLKGAIQRITNQVATLQSAATAATTMEGFKSDLPTQRVVFMYHKVPLAKPQMTAGIKLYKVADALEALSGQKKGPAERLLIEGGEAHAKVVAAARVVGAKADIRPGATQQITEQRRERYIGAIAHLASYISWAQLYEKSYPKGTIPMLSRTNLGELSGTLNLSTTWKQDILACLPSGIGKKPFLPGYVNDTRTVEEWLIGVFKGNDTTDWGQKKLPEWEPQLVGDVNQEGMGHVYEFRGVASRLKRRTLPSGLETKLLPSDEWSRFAELMFEAVREVNKEPPHEQPQVGVVLYPPPAYYPDPGLHAL